MGAPKQEEKDPGQFVVAHTDSHGKCGGKRQEQAKKRCKTDVGSRCRPSSFKICVSLAPPAKQVSYVSGPTKAHKGSYGPIWAPYEYHMGP